MANARRKTRSKSILKSEPPANTDLFAVAMLGGGLLLFLALVSYTPADAPGWWGLSSGASPTGDRQNFVGYCGTLAAAISYSAFGAAAYLIPAAMIWFGLGRFFFNARVSARGMIGFATFIVSGACLLHFQGLFFQSWHDVYNIPGAGGITGDIMGERILGNVVGTVGAFLVALIVYLVSLVMVTGFHPMHFALECQRQLRDYLEEREVRKLAEADEAERLERQRVKLEREERKLERQLEFQERRAGGKVRAKDGSLDLDPGDEEAGIKVPAALGVEEDDGEGDDTGSVPVQEERVPQIFDSSVRRVSDGERKPSLSEVLRKSKDKAAGGGGEAPVVPAREITFPDYELPEFDLLQFDETEASKPADKRALLHTQNVIIDTLGSFGIKVTAGDITRGPTITRYEIYPSAGLRVSRISQLEADLARATKAERINILAPIPGRDTVGIEIANQDKIMVQLRELLEDPAFSDPKFRIPLALGKDVYGRTIIGDLARMPHLLVAGATGAGKSVCINSIIASILFRFTPDELRFIMVDPKVVEMQMYNALPHLIVPVVTDPKKVLMALRWVVNEMERRYRMFAEVNVRNFESFNGRAANGGARSPSGPSGKARSAPARTKPPGDGHPEFDFESVDAGGVDNDEAFDTDEEIEAAAAAGPTSKFEYVFEYQDDDEEAPEAMETDESGDEEDDVIPPVSAKALLTTHAVHIAPSIHNDDITDALPGEDEDDEEGDSPGDIPQKLPYIVVIVDELADLMQTAPADMEGLIARIAQKARAAGIHLIIATQTPRADVVTGIIKANIPSRVAFQVSSALDSRVILDSKGAEKLVGKGDMLYLPPGSSQLMRAQGALISDEETLRLVEFCAEQGKPTFETDIEEDLSGGGDDGEEVSEEDEEILEKCIEVIEQERRASTSLLQRRLRLGYTRAARMMDVLEMRGIIGPGDGARPREILVEFSD